MSTVQNDFACTKATACKTAKTETVCTTEGTSTKSSTTGISKKRGRKPKGGKIIPNTSCSGNGNVREIENIILHLKCFRNEIDNRSNSNCNVATSSLQMESGMISCNPAPYNNVQNSQTAQCTVLKSYPTHNSTQSHLYHQNNDSSVMRHDYNKHINQDEDVLGNATTCRDDTHMTCREDTRMTCREDTHMTCRDATIPTCMSCNAEGMDGVRPDMAHIQKKLNEMQYNFKNNAIYNKSSDCFWCTYPFGNQAVHIPISVNQQGMYSVYGHFCMPECALAFLMDEHIDSAVKYERCALMHYMYKGIFEFKSGIKPSPNPYYMLSKFYGNLSIQEYRSLYKSHKYIMVFNKPITKVYPEIHEDNADFVMKTKTIPAHSETSNTPNSASSRVHSTLSNFVVLS